jgi:cytoplasmic iron level regulating protein YaaA (DUF328/UPF0246 family)
MIYLITCCKTKKCPSDVGGFKKSTLTDLSFNNELEESRKELIKRYEGNLDWERCLPAYKLYCGRLYKPISDDVWRNSGSDILILSALFGWIRYDDLIPIYDLRMDSTSNLSERITPKTFWKKSGKLCEVLRKIKDRFTDLLSNNYRESLGDCKEILIIPDDFGKDRGTARGEWLNDKLN